MSSSGTDDDTARAGDGRADIGGDIGGEVGADLASTALAIARRFAQGATMWCVAPVWTEHARHIAVEFVHPVIMGKRALPAVSVGAADPVAELRPVATSGDVLVMVGDAATPRAGSVLRHADAWGLTTLWIGAGDRPPAGAADHVLWVDARNAGAARHDGSVVRLYHLLWELTHVCFEHPGALVVPSAGGCADEVCVTCSDEGRPGEVLSVDDDGAASVRTAAGVETVDTTLVAPVATGDLVLIHAGTAIGVLGDDGW